MARGGTNRNPVKIGDVSGTWTVIGEPYKKEGKKGYYVRCQCGCGQIKEQEEKYIKAKRTSKCVQCVGRDRRGVAVGDKYNKWEVTGEPKVIQGDLRWPCRCECGWCRYISTNALTKGDTTMCIKCAGLLNRRGIERTLEQIKRSS